MCKNGGREWRPKGSPEPIRVHDFKDQGHGKAIPSGIFDLASEEGWMQVGIDHDTAQFAVNSIRGWWEHLGRERSPDGPHGFRSPQSAVAPTALVRACGRSRCSAWPTRQGWRSRSVTSRRAEAKWNTIEHRLFSFITSNWRGKLPTELATIVNLIASTRHPQRPEGLSRRDEGSSPAKVTVSHAELEAVALQGDGFHPEWNDTREPRVLTWHRLTLYAEGAVSARACGAVATGCFARLLSYEVDWTPRSEVLG
jgi:hypothetical protein